MFSRNRILPNRLLRLTSPTLRTYSFSFYSSSSSSFSSSSSAASSTSSTNIPSYNTPINTSKTNKVPSSIELDPNATAPIPTPSSTLLVETVEADEKARKMQAPNRATPWSKSQTPRELGMTGPRFEQTIMELQPRPYAAIELIHQQPVRWVTSRVAVCSGEVDGSAGHPKIFINVDKPEIVPCGYCGLPFANEHHRAHLEAQDSTPYPLK